MSSIDALWRKTKGERIVEADDPETEPLLGHMESTRSNFTVDVPDM